jgi:hypothetical protein
MKTETRGQTVFVKFEKPKQSITYVVNATNQEYEVNAVNGELRLIKGRVYYIPVTNKEINSDECEYIKIFSSLSDKIQIFFVKEGYVCVTPIINNIKIYDEQHICNVV